MSYIFISCFIFFFGLCPIKICQCSGMAVLTPSLKTIEAMQSDFAFVRCCSHDICTANCGRDAVGKFPDYPSEEEGGSLMIFKEKDPAEVEAALKALVSINTNSITFFVFTANAQDYNHIFFCLGEKDFSLSSFTVHFCSIFSAFCCFFKFSQGIWGKTASSPSRIRNRTLSADAFADLRRHLMATF